MKSLVRLLAIALLTGPAVLPVQAAFSSLYVFGDGACSTTTTSNQPTAYFYGNRNCNGRVWLEVLAQRQGITFDSAKNKSFFNHYSTNLLTSISQFSEPADASNSLFVVWVCDADFVGDQSLGTTNLATWNSFINQSLTNHSQAISNLYAKGARILLMPNAVNIAEIPTYSGSAPEKKSFVRDRVIDFNAGLATRLNQARASLPGLTIYSPDFFSLLEDMLVRAAYYGLTNALSGPGGHTVGALTVTSLNPWHLDGPGAYYIFWDGTDPSARAHAIMADIAQQLISPSSITNLTLLQGSNRLDAVNLPIGLGGYVDGRTDLVAGNWTSLTNFNSTTATQSIFAPASGPGPFYRLRFPFAWSWP